jgi:hypothetical protein
MTPSNQEFLQHLFKDDAPFVHVTDFTYDPGNIPSDKHLIAWKGDWFSRYKMKTGSNQYFTVSIFNPDDQGVARRRKALFLRTRVIVLDDVREKLSMDAVSRLPEPAWILETSLGSEQWGYILDTPCSDRHRVENLLDGLVANGLAPEGRDPGMKGVTRYVRLPEGYNTKASKMIDGKPFNCHMKEWHPARTSTLEALAAPFNVDLDAVRREARTDGAADIPDHPLLQIPDVIHIKEVRSNGRFDITCPWVDEHTGGDDSGTAIFTNDDGSIGFKCHHGGCMDRTARHLVKYIDSAAPGFGEVFSNWKMKRMFADITGDTPVIEPGVSFMDTTVSDTSPTINDLLDTLKREVHTSPEARDIAQKILRLLESLPTMDRQHWHNEVCDNMRWTKQEFKSILKDLRAEWYTGSQEDMTFLSDVIYVKEQNRLYDYNTQIFYTPEAFHNSFSHLDSEARKTALQEGAVQKVDKIDFAPKQARIYTKDGIVYGNTWCASKVSTGTPGDCSRWLDHWDAMGWGEHRKHHLQWMAYTLKHPEDKINHILLLGGEEGTGKDFILQPLIEAMGDYCTEIQGDDLLSNHNEYLLSTKYLNINETELGDHREAKAISNKLKPLAAAPPRTLRMNPKGITAINVTNILNATMTTNSTLPIQLNGPSRRFYATWTDLSIRDENEEVTPDWIKYWTDRWTWMNAGGHAHCIHYLLNEVDISKFNPGAPPPMTDFLRNIREASKSPVQQTIEAFIRNRVGAFQSDLITASEMASTIKAASIMHSDLIYADANWFNAINVGKKLADVSNCIQLRANAGKRHVRMWAIRNLDRYKVMPPSLLLMEYDKQIARCKSADNARLKIAE